MRLEPERPYYGPGDIGGNQTGNSIIESEPNRPYIIVMCGLQGAGKSTVAGIIAGRLQATLYRSDVIREELSGQGKLPREKFSPEANDIVYAEMAKKAQDQIQIGRSVLMDATFSKKKYRDQMQRLANDLGVGFQVVEVIITDEEIIEERLANRTEEDASKADYKVYLKAKSSFDPVTEPHVTIINNGTMENLRSQIDQYLSE